MNIFNLFKNRFIFVSKLGESLTPNAAEFSGKTVLYVIFIIKTDGSILWYIGVTNNLSKRRWEHLNCVKNGKNKKLYNAIIKYGIENFNISVLKLNFDFSDKTVRRLEVRLIQKFKPNLNIQNMLSTGKLSEETKAKISGALKGITLSAETKEKISASNKGLNKGRLTHNSKAVIAIPIDNGPILEFDSARRLAQHFGLNVTAISKAIKRNSIVQKKYRVFYKD